VALSVLVFDRTGSAYATAGLFLASRFLPALLAPVVVARAEQPPPRFALPVIYCGEAAAFAGLALVAEHFSLAAVIALAVVDGLLALTGRALTRAVVAALLEPTGELRSGNAVLNIAFTGGAAVGPGIAGVIVAGFGVPAALLLDAGSFYLSAWILLLTPLPHAEAEPGSLRQRVRAGFRYVRRNAVLSRLLAAQGAAFVFFTTVLPIEVIYAKETLGAGDSGYGLLLTAWGAGMVFGGLIFARVRRAPLPHLFFFSTVAVGVGYLGLAAAPGLAVACAASLVGGAGNGVQWVTTVSAVQELTAAEMQARVMGVLEAIAAAMPGIGFLLGGAVAAGSGPRATYLVAGAGIFAIVALAAPTLGSRWEKGGREPLPNGAADEDEVILELIPAGAVSGPDRRS
jgi:MFS family permease